MRGKFSLPLMIASVAATAMLWPSRPLSITATNPPIAPLLDTDDDFLPDAVEWAVLTNAGLADTDGDQIPDFVEVVELGSPRNESVPLPADQQMRLVVTGPAPGSPETLTWMHVFLRVMPSIAGLNGIGGVESFTTWLDVPALPGLQIPLNSFAAGGLVIRERATANDGYWIQVSVPLVSPQILQAFLPCTIWAESVVGGVPLSNGVKLLDFDGDIVTLVPYGDDRFALQTIGQIVAPLPGAESNRVCVLDLEEVTSGPGGTVYQVADANCEDCNELECGAGCSESAGMVITIPGGAGLLSGN